MAYFPGGTPTTPSAPTPPGRIELDLARKGKQVLATMTFDSAGKRWERTITRAAACADMVFGALALLDPEVTCTSPTPAQSASAAAVEPVLPASPPPPPPAEAPSLAPPLLSPDGPRLHAGMLSVVSIGNAPVVVGGVGLTFDVRWPRFSVVLEGRALLAPSADVDGLPVRSGFRFTFVSASISGCVHSTWAFACARAQVGSLSAAHVLASIDPDHALLAGVGFRFGRDWEMTPSLALRTYLDAMMEYLPARLLGREPGPATWHAPLMSGSIGLGPVISF